MCKQKRQRIWTPGDRMMAECGPGPLDGDGKRAWSGSVWWRAGEEQRR